MMDRRLLVTSTDLMMVQFLLPHVLYLRANGYEVEVACSDVGGRLAEVRKRLGTDSVHQVSLTRSPFRFGNLYGYRALVKIINAGKFDLIWTNEPVMGVMTRLAARRVRKLGTKVIYMTHGYHFFTGCSPWLWLFYPVEKMASNFCDAIVTVSREDYQRSVDHFHAPIVYYIHGIGMDESRFAVSVDKKEMRRRLGLPKDAFVIVSVGELKSHKNHATVIRAIANLERKNLYYLICGRGELLESLRSLAERLGVADRVKFLGYRRDIPDILVASDVFVFPSTREGLGLAALEAMAVGLPVVASRIRGIVDYVQDGETGITCTPRDYAGFAKAIDVLISDEGLRFRLGSNGCGKIQEYCLAQSMTEVKEILDEMH